MTRRRRRGLRVVGLGVTGVLLALAGCASDQALKVRSNRFDAPPFVPGAGWQLWGGGGLAPATDFWAVRSGLRVHVSSDVILASRPGQDRLVVFVEFYPAGRFAFDPGGVRLVRPDGLSRDVAESTARWWEDWASTMPGPPYQSEGLPFWVRLDLLVPEPPAPFLVWVGGMVHRGDPVPPLRLRVRSLTS